MFVVATAGHVDHGKSTLVRALTGMEPDRWAEERRRGMTIDLGYAWTRLPSGGDLAFVDVPGHERFIGNMLAGVGPAPAVLFVVAADEGWSRQSTEHLAAIDALGIEHGLVAVTRSDLADPAPAAVEALERVGRTSLGAGPIEAVAVSGTTGAGLPELRAALDRLVSRLPVPADTNRTRLWVDRAFTVRGSGTVVTGTLGTGWVAVDRDLELVRTTGDRRTVTVRGLESLRQSVDQVSAVARVAANLRSVSLDEVGRGDALLSPGDWRPSRILDVRVDGPATDLPAELVLHVGTAALPVRVRPLGSSYARLTLTSPAPLQAGDRGILRDPGRQEIVSGVVVLDVDPPALTRRGAAARRAAALLSSGGPGDVVSELGRRGAARRADLVALGVLPNLLTPVSDDLHGVDDWLVGPQQWGLWQRALLAAVDDYVTAHPLAPRMPLDAARRATGIPAGTLVPAVARACGLTVADGTISRPETRRDLSAVDRALAELESRWESSPFEAPDADELHRLGLGPRQLAALAAEGRVLRLPGDVVLGPHAANRAAAIVAGLPQPFSASEARQAWVTSRRVAIPLLEHLDRLGATERLDGGVRRVSDGQSG